MTDPGLIPHLFRLEAGKITSVLCRQFGLEQIEVAEDIVAETFLAALETWPYKGVPAQPAAWLYTVAKNKTRNYLSRQQLFQKKISGELQQVPSSYIEPDPDLSPENIQDSQLRMLFALSHPALPEESQVCLALKILCGFSIIEIAHALMISVDAVNKRMTRAKKVFRDQKLTVDMPNANELLDRLPVVLSSLYLLFNEGWYSETNDQVVRKELCAEAIRLTILLSENESTDLPAVNALLALMCFQSSRLDARDAGGALPLLYEDQDERLWNQELIARGAGYLHKGSYGTYVSKYHLEAMIAYYQTSKSLRDANWNIILELYDKLLQIQYSPVAALNRLYALAKARGKAQAIEAAEMLSLTDSPYYFSLMADLYSDSDPGKARSYLERSIELAKTEVDRQVLQNRKIILDNMIKSA